MFRTMRCFLRLEQYQARRLCEIRSELIGYTKGHLPANHVIGGKAVLVLVFKPGGLGTAEWDGKE